MNKKVSKSILIISIILICLLAFTACVQDDIKTEDKKLGLPNGTNQIEFYIGKVNLESIVLNVFVKNVPTASVVVTRDMIRQEDLAKLEIIGLHTIVITYDKMVCNLTIVINNTPAQTEFNVKFDSKGGTAVADYLGSVIDAIPLTTLEGFNFGGWYESEEFQGEKLVTPFYIKKNTTFYAKWIDERFYEVTFIGKDTKILDKQRIEYGKSAIPPTPPAIPGYNFDKWEGDYTNLTGNVKEIQVFAIYKEKKVTITYNSEMYADGSKVVEVAYGKDLDIPEIVPVKEGYTGVWIDLSTNRAPVLTTITKDMTIKAVYTIKTFKIIFINDNGINIEKSVIYGENLPLTAVPTVPERIGYNSRWVIQGTENAPNFINIKDNMFIQAGYTKKSYQVTFKEGTSQIGETKVYLYNEVINSPPDLNKGVGFIVNWHKKSELSDQKTIFPYTVDNNVVFYANIIDDRTYTVEFCIPSNIDGQTTTEHKVYKSQTVRRTQNALPPTIQILKYDFKGWDKSFSNILEDMTHSNGKCVTAILELKSYDVKFYNVNSEFDFVEVSSQRIVHDGEVNSSNITNNPPSEDFSFDGWYTNSTYTSTKIDFSSNYIVTHAVSFYPKWLNSKSGTPGLSFADVEDEESSSCVVNGYSHQGEASVDISIPDYYDGKKVVGITDNAFANAYDIINSIFISQYIKNIGQSAFISLTSLRHFTLAESNSYFMIEDNILYNKEQSVLIACPNLATIDDSGIIEIKSTVSTISGGAFANNDKITEVMFASGSIIDKIGDNAFFACINLKSITLPDSLTTIGDNAFAECEKLATVNAGDTSSSLTTIGIGALDTTAWFASKTSTVTLGSVLVKYVGSETVVTIENFIKAIAANAFLGNDKIISIIIETDSILEKIGDNAFKNCINLENIVIKKTVFVDAGEDTFAGIKLGAILKVKANVLQNYKDSLAYNSFTEDYIIAIN